MNARRMPLEVQFGMSASSSGYFLRRSRARRSDSDSISSLSALGNGSICKSFLWGRMESFPINRLIYSHSIRHISSARMHLSVPRNDALQEQCEPFQRTVIKLHLTTSPFEVDLLPAPDFFARTFCEKVSIGGVQVAHDSLC